MPSILLCAAEDSQILLKSLIGSFTCSICLRVIRHADVLVDIQKAAKICGKFRCEPDVSVGYDFPRNSIVWGHVGSIESGHSFRVDGLVTWEKYGRFGAVCICDGEDCIVSS